jgi:hypothetical protein
MKSLLSQANRTRKGHIQSIGKVGFEYALNPFTALQAVVTSSTCDDKIDLAQGHQDGLGPNGFRTKVN